ncbi:MAG: hypothetical protein EXS24_07195 [Pedosphaera sp.]|nr:hypothetical protein [Pedosphaera sp.]
MKRVLLAILVAATAIGCVTHNFSNLTLREHPRVATGLYPVELIWETNEQAVRLESIKPLIIIGTNVFPMQKTLLLKNRWEALVPADKTVTNLYYRIRVDWQFNTIPFPEKNSQMSPQYQLRIRD